MHEKAKTAALRNNQVSAGADLRREAFALPCSMTDKQIAAVMAEVFSAAI